MGSTVVMETTEKLQIIALPDLNKRANSKIQEIQENRYYYIPPGARQAGRPRFVTWDSTVPAPWETDSGLHSLILIKSLKPS